MAEAVGSHSEILRNKDRRTFVVTWRATPHSAKMGIKGTPAPTKQDGSQLRIGVVHARWNLPIIQALLDGALNKLRELGVKEENIVVQAVPGSFELPFACSKWALLSSHSRDPDAIPVALE